MMKHISIHAILIVAFYTYCHGQNKSSSNGTIQPATSGVVNSYGPTNITRNIEEDKRGNIWMATWEGVFRYDGKSFTNVTSEVSSSRFFSVLEDRKAKLWFGSIGGGVYSYDGYFFQNFTTKDGLLNNEVVCIYEDREGIIWFGVNGGVSRYDGKTFRNFILSGDSMVEDRSGKTFPEVTRPPHEVNSIIQDKTGKFWIGTRDNSFVYDGKIFTALMHNGKPFRNVRCIIEDKKGNIWFGGNDGLWRYDGSAFTNVAPKFAGYIYEDRNGNIWTSAESTPGWALSRYDAKTLYDKTPVVTEIMTNVGMVFGIKEAIDGSIWFGTGDGVYRYDGNTTVNFKKQEGVK